MPPRSRLPVPGVGEPPHSRRHGGSHGRATSLTAGTRGSAEGRSRAAPRRCVPGGKGKDEKEGKGEEGGGPAGSRPPLAPAPPPPLPVMAAGGPRQRGEAARAGPAGS